MIPLHTLYYFNYLSRIGLEWKLNASTGSARKKKTEVEHDAIDKTFHLTSIMPRKIIDLNCVELLQEII